MPQEYANEQVSLRYATKTNGVRRCGFVIGNEKDGIFPVMYLEELYEKYQCGKTLEKICSDAAVAYEQFAKVDLKYTVIRQIK